MRMLRPLLMLSANIASISARKQLGITAVRFSSSMNTESTVSTKSSDSQSHFDALEALKRADAVCFDVDSTVIPEEGIDVIAAHMGKGEQVAALTREAMEGTMDFRTALANRCAIIKPSKKDLQDLAAKHPVVLSPGVEDFIELLHSRGQHVYLVSGGFRQMINPVADAVNVPYHRVFANNLLFDEESGAYKGFDADEPTSADGGKARVLDMLKDTHGYQTVVMIGDGATDMQAKPPADAFIGYGGTSARENVMAGADLFVYDFAELSAALLK